MSSAPKRRADKSLVFEGAPQFRPTLSPKEVLQAGSFGGTYFRPIQSTITKRSYTKGEAWKELPKDWIEGLDLKRDVISPVYRAARNKYSAKCGASLEEWESKGWIVPQDPYGWFQWYCRFFQGRRTDDDDRQIDRWIGVCGKKGRWKNNLLGKCFRAGKPFDDFSVSPAVRQTLLHWAYEITEADLDAYTRAQGNAGAPSGAPARTPTSKPEGPSNPRSSSIPGKRKRI